jgi:hypothetical protein
MKTWTILAATLLAFSTPAQAEVKSQADHGFSVVHIADADPAAVWARLIVPKNYWSKAHSWSGSVEGFYLEPRAGGCFCENMLAKDPKAKTKITGTVEHMRVIFADPGKVLRMQGALGPLQAEAVLGTLTVAIVPAKSGLGSTVSFAYVVGGYMRFKTPEIAKAVDTVIGEQFESMIKPFVKTVGDPVPLLNDGQIGPLDDASGEGESAPKQNEWSLDLDTLDAEPAKVKPTVAAAKPKAKTAVKPVAKSKPKTAVKPTPKPSVTPKAKPKIVPKKDPEVR